MTQHHRGIELSSIPEASLKPTSTPLIESKSGNKPTDIKREVEVVIIQNSSRTSAPRSRIESKGDIRQINEVRDTSTIGGALLSQFYSTDPDPEVRKQHRCMAVNAILEIASQVSVDKQKEFVNEYCKQFHPDISLEKLNKIYATYAVGEKKQISSKKGESKLYQKLSKLKEKRKDLYDQITLSRQEYQEYYKEHKGRDNQKDKEALKETIKDLSKQLKECNKESKKLQEKLYNDEQKPAVQKELAIIYDQIRSLAAAQDVLMPSGSKQEILSGPMRPILEHLCTSPEDYIGNLLNAPLVRLESEEPTLSELRSTFQSSLKISDCLYISPKSGGANDPGQHGGNYLLCYQTADGTIRSQVVFFKQATDDGFANHRENIAEVMAGHIMNGVVGDHAAAIILATPEKKEEKDSNPEDVYVGSFFFKKFSDFHTEAHSIINAPAGKRGKGSLGGQNINNYFGNPDFQHGFNELAKTFNVTNLAKALMGNLLVGNHQIHTQNGGLAELAGGKEPVTLDFGGAFRRGFITKYRPDPKAEEQPGQFPKAVHPYQIKGRKYDVAYLLAFPEEIRESAEFINGIDAVARFNNTTLCEYIDAAVDYSIHYYGEAAFLENFAYELDTTGREIIRSGSLDKQVTATKEFLHNRLFARQLSLRGFCLERQLLNPEFDNEEIFAENPIYSKYRFTKCDRSLICNDIEEINKFLERINNLPVNNRALANEVESLQKFLEYASKKYFLNDPEDQEVIIQALNESYRAVMAAAKTLPDSIEKAAILKDLNDTFLSTVEVADIKPEHKIDILQQNKEAPRLPREIFHAAAKGNIRRTLEKYFHSHELQIIHINIPDEEGYTLLMYAAANGHAEVVEYLLNVMGGKHELVYALQTLRNPDGLNPLMLAVERGNHDPARFASTAAALLRRNELNVNEVYPDGSGDTVLIRAAKLGNVQLVNQLLLKPGINIGQKNAQGNSALMIAIQRADVAMMDSLLNAPGNHGANYYNQALHAAIETQNIALIDQLLSADAGAKVHEAVNGVTPLVFAVQQGRYFAAHRLIKRYRARLQDIPNDIAFNFPAPNPDTPDHHKFRDVLEAMHQLTVANPNLNHAHLNREQPPASRASSRWKKARKYAEMFFWLVAFTIMGLAVAAFALTTYGLPVIAAWWGFSYVMVALTALSAIMLRFKLMDNVDNNWDQLFLDIYPEVEYTEALRHAKTLDQQRPLPQRSDYPAGEEGDIAYRDAIAVIDNQIQNRAKPSDFVALPASPAVGAKLKLDPEKREKLLNMVNTALNALMVKGERQRIAQYALPDGAANQDEQLGADIASLKTMQFYLQRLKAHPQGNNADVIASVLDHPDFRIAYREFKGEDNIQVARDDNSTILGRLRNTKLHPKTMMGEWFEIKNEIFSWPANKTWTDKALYIPLLILKPIGAVVLIGTSPVYVLLAGVERIWRWAHSPTYAAAPHLPAAHNVNNGFLAPPEAAHEGGDWMEVHLHDPAEVPQAAGVEDEPNPFLFAAAPVNANPPEINHNGKKAVRWTLYFLAAVLTLGLLFVMAALTLAMSNSKIATRFSNFIMDRFLGGDHGDRATDLTKGLYGPAIMGGFVGGGGLALLGASKAALKVNATSYQEFKPARDKLLHDQEVRLQHFDTEGPVDFGFKNRVLLYLSASTFGLSEVLHRRLRPYRTTLEEQQQPEVPADLSWQQWNTMRRQYYNYREKEGQRNIFRSLIKLLTLVFIIAMTCIVTTAGIALGFTPVGWAIAGAIIAFYTFISAFKWWRNRKPAPADTELNEAIPPVAPVDPAQGLDLMPEMLRPPHTGISSSVDAAAEPLSPVSSNPLSQPPREDKGGVGSDADIEVKIDHKHVIDVKPEDVEKAINQGSIKHVHLEKRLDQLKDERSAIQRQQFQSPHKQNEKRLEIIDPEIINLERQLENSSSVRTVSLPGASSSSSSTQPKTNTAGHDIKPHERKRAANVTYHEECRNLEGLLAGLDRSLKIGIQNAKYDAETPSQMQERVAQFNKLAAQLSQAHWTIEDRFKRLFEDARDKKDLLETLITARIKKDLHKELIKKALLKEQKSTQQLASESSKDEQKAAERVSSPLTSSQAEFERRISTAGARNKRPSTAGTPSTSGTEKQKNQAAILTGASNSAGYGSTSSSSMFGHSGKTSKRPDGKPETKDQAATSTGARNGAGYQSANDGGMVASGSQRATQKTEQTKMSLLGSSNKRNYGSIS